MRVAQCEFTIDYLEWVSSGGQKLPANGVALTVTLRATDVFDLWVPRSRKRSGFSVYNPLVRLHDEWEKVMEYGIDGSGE